MEEISADLLKTISKRTDAGELHWEEGEAGVLRASFDLKLTANLLPYADFPADRKASLTLTENGKTIFDLAPTTELELQVLRVLYRRAALQVEARKRGQ